MDKLVILYLILPILHTVGAFGKIEQLNDRLEQFEACNIRITARFRNLDIEPFFVTLALLDANKRGNRTFLRQIWNIHKIPVHMFKYRDPVCTFDLIVHFENGRFDTKNYWNDLYRQYEYMVNKYLVYVLFREKLISEHSEIVLQMKYVALSKIFVWSVLNKVSEFDSVKDLLFSEVFYICEILNWPNIYEIFTLEENIQNFNIKTQMDIKANEIQNQFYWNP